MKEIQIDNMFKKPSIAKPVIFSLLAGVVLATGALGYLYLRFLKAEPVACNYTAQQIWAGQYPKQVDKAKADWDSLMSKASDVYFGK